MKVNIGKGITLDVDADQIKGDVMSHVVMIGLRNILMDCHAGITKADNPDDYVQKSEAKALAKLEAMYAGDLRIARQSSGVTRDPVRAEALSMARKAISGIFYFAPKTGEWKIRDQAMWVEIKSAYGSDYDFGNPDQLRDVFDLLVEAQADECMAEAEQVVAIKSAAKKPVNIAGLVK